MAKVIRISALLAVCIASLNGFCGVESVTRLSPTSARIVWRQAKDNITPAERLRYRIFYGMDGTRMIAEGVKVTVTGQTEAVLADLPANQPLQFAVFAVDEAGNVEVNAIRKTFTGVAAGVEDWEDY